MSFDDAARPAGRRPVLVSRRRTRAVLPTLIVLGVVLVLFAVFANFYTELLWYRSVGFTGVFRTELLTKLLLFVVFGLALGLLVAGNLVIAYRSRPGYTLATVEDANLERYRAGVDPFRRIAVIGVTVVLTLFGGSSAAGQWRTYLLWRNSVDFGATDPQFHRDISFFTFDLPWYRFVLSFAFTAVILSALVSVAAHYLYGGVKLQPAGDRVSSLARTHLSILLGSFVLLKAVAYWLDRYSLETRDARIGSADFTGMTYTDVHALLPAKGVLASIAAVCAVIFFLHAVRPVWLLVGFAAPLLVLSAIIAGAIIPAIIQNFNVKPNESAKEGTYLSRNIAATRTAYGLTASSDTSLASTGQTGAAAAAGATVNAAEPPNVRLIDPKVVPETFRQVQQNRSFYGFPDVLDVDRYAIDGKVQDTVVAVREVDLAGVPRRNWINDHTVYTHGFGFVAARGNEQQVNGEPSFVEKDIPPSGGLGKYEPRIYFGEKSPEYSIVGGPGPAHELDYLTDDQGGTGQQSFTYAGKGGAPIGSLFNRAMFAMRFQSGQILLSTKFINAQSKVLYVREPRARVQKVAPWLTVDGDPYPAIVDGRIQWILDGYTTSGGYPYSRRQTLDDATTDTLSNTAAVAAQAAARINYIRNSVKATVDAYDGTVKLYAWDESDPVLRTWEHAFPNTVLPKSAISPGLMQHLRYPEDLFKVQRTLLAEYHVTDPQQFYGGQDFWRIPSDPPGKTPQPPYYLTLQMPGAARPEFSLTTTFVPRSSAADDKQRANLTAFAAVQAEPGPGYGQLRILRVPSNTTIQGAPQIYNTMQGDRAVSDTVRQLQSGKSEVDFGNLLTLPLDGGLLYVQPVYVKAAGDTAYPLLQDVIVAYRGRVSNQGSSKDSRDTEKVAIAPTFSEAFAKAVTAAGAPSTSPPGTGSPTPTPTPTPTGTQGGGGTVSPALRQALADADRAYQDSQTALRAGDFTAYGQAQQRLLDAITRAKALAGQGTAPPATSTPRASPSPTSTTKQALASN